ncbi:phage repressor [Mesorhizobium sp. M1A.F.Ca.IN.020.03.2.1]|uniref:S24 family peptidase n=1 Tax=Mesorhizobium sp. M1A.F.Ca.IN.020.03.2.1 TaxID=2496769 RepID=UPI000FD5A946|nr:S24 family peptidase [Mesorhizobium sp. M1A.F.Ca.IN.020.03.2.1]RUV07972.1 phage repressor [Mesorhizobium sp. M1A.F.Ca.IN.020.03.2.1]
MELRDVVKRVESRLSELGLSAAAASTRAGLSKDAIRNMQRAAKDGTRQGVSTNTLAALAPVLDTNVAWLLGDRADDEPGESEDVRHVKVTGFVQAGAWAETWEWSDDEVYSVPVPDDPALRAFGLHAAETRGPSMNKRYPEKTVLVFTDLIETGAALELGKRYIVERERADGLREATVKTLWRDENDKIWLLPESNDPRFQEPIPIDGGEDDTVRVVGRVVYAVSKE